MHRTQRIGRSGFHSKPFGNNKRIILVKPAHEETQNSIFTTLPTVLRLSKVTRRTMIMEVPVVIMTRRYSKSILFVMGYLL